MKATLHTEKIIAVTAVYKVSFTGYRPSKLGFGVDDERCAALKQKIYDNIEVLIYSGATDFYSGMALGVDMWCAQAVLELRKLRPEITLTAVIPCPGQDEKWSAADRALYRDTVAQCNNVICVSRAYTKDCMFERNRRLVDMCDLLLAVYDGKSGGTHYTVEYAEKKGRKIIIIDPNSI